MTDKKPSRPTRSRPAKKSPAAEKAVAPKSEAKVEAKVETKVEEKEEVKPLPEVAEPVKAPEPPKAEAILPSYEPAKTAPPEGDTGWVPADSGLTQTLYGAGRIKNRLRTRRGKFG